MFDWTYFILITMYKLSNYMQNYPRLITRVVPESPLLKGSWHPVFNYEFRPSWCGPLTRFLVRISTMNVLLSSSLFAVSGATHETLILCIVV